MGDRAGSAVRGLLKRAACYNAPGFAPGVVGCGAPPRRLIGGGAHFRRKGRLPRQPRLLFRLLPGALCGRDLLDGHDVIRPLFAETLEIEVRDERRQRQLPRFLAVIVKLAELFRIHAQLERHLHVGVGQMESPARLDPGHEFIGDERSLVRHGLAAAIGEQK